MVEEKKNKILTSTKYETNGGSAVPLRGSGGWDEVGDDKRTEFEVEMWTSSGQSEWD